MVAARAYRHPDVLSLKFMDFAAPLVLGRGGSGSERCSRRSGGVKVQAGVLYFFFPLVKARHFPFTNALTAAVFHSLRVVKDAEKRQQTSCICFLKKTKDGGFSEGKEFAATGLDILQKENLVGDYFWQSLAIY